MDITSQFPKLKKNLSLDVPEKRIWLGLVLKTAMSKVELFEISCTRSSGERLLLLALYLLLPRTKIPGVRGNEHF